MTLHTYQEVLEAVTSKDQRAKNALNWLLSMQTRAEEIVGDSLDYNGAGFRAKYGNRDDAKTARELLGKQWSPKDRRAAHALCYTYRRQLTARANGCITRAEVGSFRIRAIHDSGSRAYAKYVQGPPHQPVHAPAVRSYRKSDPVVDLRKALSNLSSAIEQLKAA